MKEQWISIKGISTKYQIDEEDLKELVGHEWVTYSETCHTWLIDEKSFLDYLELHRKQENRTQIIEKLDQLNVQLNNKLRMCEEANATHAITNQLLPLYPLIIRDFMIYFNPGRVRDIFYSLAMGEHVEDLSKSHGTNIITTLRIYNYAVRRLKLKVSGHFRATDKYRNCIELLDRRYIKANLEYKELCRKKEQEKEELKKEYVKLEKRCKTLKNKDDTILKRLQAKNQIIKELRQTLRLEEGRRLNRLPVLYTEASRRTTLLMRIKNFFFARKLT